MKIEQILRHHPQTLSFLAGAGLLGSGTHAFKCRGFAPHGKIAGADLWPLSHNGSTNLDMHPLKTPDFIDFTSTDVIDVGHLKITGLRDWTTEGEAIIDSEIIVIDGTNTTSSAKSWVWIISGEFTFYNPATGHHNTGDITGTPQSGGDALVRIPALQGLIQHAGLAVPSGSFAIVTNLRGELLLGATANEETDFKLLVDPDPHLGSVGENYYSEEDAFMVLKGRGRDIPHLHPHHFEGPCFIKMRAESTTDDDRVRGGFDAVVFKK